MKQSQLFCKTKKQVAGEEGDGYKFLIKGDFIEKISSGIYSFLPLGYRVHKNIENIIRDEMNKVGAQELFMNSLIEKQIWEKTNRWETIDPPLFVVKDRHKKEFGLGSTHEEIIVGLAKSRIFSYKDLPLGLYQIQTKFRNEMRSTGGLLRCREFSMKDLYSFHNSQKDFDNYFEKIADLYEKIFARCGLKAFKSEASGGTISGSTKTYEFQIENELGEDKVIYCSNCEWAVNTEIFEFKQGIKCPKCGKEVKEIKTIEVGHIFSLGTKYAKPFDLSFTNKDGKKELVIMGCYGIGIGRLLGAIAEVCRDDRGLVWPKQVAPFHYHLIPVEMDNKKVITTAEKIYKDLEKAGDFVLYDDRQDKSVGEKFADADLIGIPTRIVISQKTLEKKSAEIKQREGEGMELIKIDNLLSRLKIENSMKIEN